MDYEEVAVTVKMPLLLDFCTPRRSDDEKTIYHYNFDKNLNVIDFGEKTIPFVDCGTHSLEMITKTFAQRESEDDDRVFYELDTITKVSREGNDEDITMMQGLLETESNHRLQREAYNFSFNIGYLELMTKTDVIRERDDE